MAAYRREHIVGQRAMIVGQANAPVAYGRDSAGPSVQDRPPRAAREFPIGFESAAGISAGSSEDIEVKPQVLFRGERLAVASSLALGFDIEDIKIGKDSQLAANGNMPAECFRDISVGVRMMLDTAQPGIEIILSVLNSTAASTLFFKAVMYGTVVD